LKELKQMRIQDLRTEKRQDRTRVAATVVWEDCDRPSYELFFETGNDYANALTCNPNAFLIGSIVPALHYGEERVFIDAEICPELRKHLMNVMLTLCHWYYRDTRQPVRIEAPSQSRLPSPRTPERAGLFFSGGIDSFATLRSNRINFPPEHPRYIRDGMIAFGLEIDDPQAFHYLLDLLSNTAQQIGLNLIPVSTSVYLPYRDEDAQNRWEFWADKFMGAALAAIAHAFARYFTVFSIACNFGLPHLQPDSLHPLLDYSSADLRVPFDGIALSRFKKTKLVAQWDDALQNLRVCNQFRDYQAHRLNCGRCEKCVRTMLALEAVGVLGRTSAFPRQDLPADLVRKAVRFRDLLTEPWYQDQEMMNALTARGRDDLVQVIEEKIARYHSHKPRFRETVKRLDREYLHGNLRRVMSQIRS
jgi:hypothetical protein